MRWLRLLRVFYRTSIQTDMEYRADFFTRLIASLLGLLTTIGSLAIAYQYADTIAGWKFSHAMVLLAIYYLMDGLIEMFVAPNMRTIMSQVREGTLDFVLLKPISAQFMATFRTLNVWRIGNVLVGLGLSVYAITNMAVGIGVGQALLFAVTLAGGLGVVYSFWLVLVTLTFWFVRIDNLEQIIWQAFEAGRYPVEIYPRWLQMALTYVVPVVFIITVPAGALAGRVSGWTALLAVLTSVIVVTAASAFWRFGLKHYTGASA